MEQSKNLKIIHFNDVYELKEELTDPVGGSARFKTAIDHFKDENTVVVFSGDLFSPSLFSNVTKGEHMVYPMNEFGTDVACLGNHDFDIDSDSLEKRLRECKFPWVLSNVFDINTGKQFGGGLEYYDIEDRKSYTSYIIEKAGLKIGIIGLAEYDWLQILPISTEDLDYEDFVTCSQRLYPILKDNYGCDLVFAVTHMRNYNDEKLAAEFDKYDLILGGHDHVSECKNVNGTYYIKSGSDFKQFSVITLKFVEGKEIDKLSIDEAKNLYKGKYLFERELIDVTKKFEQNKDMLEHFEKYEKLFHEKMQMTLGFTEVDLETTFKVIRTQEENFSNFVADVIRLSSDVDCVIMNTGTIRSDCVFHKGPLLYANLSKALPYTDYIVYIELTGEQLYRALENSVSKYPQYEGRFPAVSNIQFTFDPDAEPLKRITIDSIKVGNKPIDMQKIYTVGTKYYLSIGKDGYEMMMEGKCLTDLVNAEDITSIVRKFFEMVDKEEFLDVWSDYETKREKITNQKDNLPQPTRLLRKSSTYLKKTQKIKNLVCLVNDLIEKDGKKYISISPKIENRIVNLKKKVDS